MNIRIALSPQSVLRSLLLAVATLTLVHAVAHGFKYYVVANNSFAKELIESVVRLFSLNREANIPTWYSSSTLLVSSLLLAIITVAQKDISSPYSRHWGALALIFLYLSLDETAIIHEMTPKALQLILQTNGSLYYAYVIIPGALGVLILGLAYRGFLVHLPPKTRLLFTVAGIIYVGGALGLDALGAYYVAQHGEVGIARGALTIFEEFLEMLGVAIFVYALLEYLNSHLTSVELHPRPPTIAHAGCSGPGVGGFRQGSRAPVGAAPHPLPTGEAPSAHGGQ
jgi:hypothetical protein